MVWVGDSAGSGGAASDASSGNSMCGVSGGSGRMGRGEGRVLELRTGRLRVVLGLVIGRFLPLGSAGDFFAVFRLMRFDLVGLALRRGRAVFCRVAWRTRRPADCAAFTERGFFVFIPDSNAFSGSPIRSDAHKTTRALHQPQRESRVFRFQPEGSHSQPFA